MKFAWMIAAWLGPMVMIGLVTLAEATLRSWLILIAAAAAALTAYEVGRTTIRLNAILARVTAIRPEDQAAAEPEGSPR